MKQFPLFCALLFLVAPVWASSNKKIKIKGDRSVQFHYEPDSSSLDHKENVKLLKGFYDFTVAVKEDNYQAYLNALSPETNERIGAEKLKRKYIKFKGYGINLFGKIQIRSIRKFERKTPEKSDVYICIVKLPDGQKIAKRVGFDPLKREKFKGTETFFGLHMVRTEAGYKAVILF